MNLCQLKEAKKKVKLRFNDIEEARKRANSQLAVIDVREDELEAAAAEERLCVVCKEEAKKIVLMSCRHCCLCRACADNPLLKKCPLSRESVVSKMRFLYDHSDDDDDDDDDDSIHRNQQLK